MSLLGLLDIFTKQAPLFLIVTTLYIISAIIVRVLKKNISSISAYIMRGLAKVLMISTIPLLITIYSSTIAVNSFVSSLSNITNIQISRATNLLSSLPAIFSLGVSIILGVAILFMESGRFVSPLTKEIENVNIDNLGKVAIKILDIVSFVLSIILVYSILLLAIFPTNMTLINTILIISQVYLYIIIFDIIFSILAAASSKRLRPNINVEKI